MKLDQAGSVHGVEACQWKDASLPVSQKYAALSDYVLAYPVDNDSPVRKCFTRNSTCSAQICYLSSTGFPYALDLTNPGMSKGPQSKTKPKSVFLAIWRSGTIQFRQRRPRPRLTNHVDWPICLGDASGWPT
ncbi:hypothetical protein XPA_003964 [Xanthoria parietina]